MLVRLAACGVCHTDLYTASGADPTGYAPCVLGHEGAGVVERVGPGVTLGRARAITSSRSSRPNAASASTAGAVGRTAASRSATMQGQGYLPDGTTRLSRDGEPMRHFMGTSTFAEYTVMPEIALAKVSPEASLEGCAPFACGLATGIGAALYTADVQPGSTCVVFGCGLVGLGAVIGCRLAGAERIVAIDLSEGRLESARHHGATDTRARRRRHGRLDSRARPAASAPTTRSRRPGTSHVMRQAVEAAREAWGLATMVGVAGKGETLDIVPRLLITGRRVTGSSFGGVKGRTQVPQLVDRWLAGEIDVESLLSHRLTLDEVNRGFELMEAQDGIRSVIAFD